MNHTRFMFLSLLFISFLCIVFYVYPFIRGKKDELGNPPTNTESHEIKKLIIVPKQDELGNSAPNTESHEIEKLIIVPKQDELGNPAPNTESHEIESNISKHDVILYLAPQIESDLNNLIQSLKSLNHLHNWSFEEIIIFHNDLTPCIKSFISKYTPTGRKIVFYEVDLATFPPNFDPSQHSPNWRHGESARNSWGYYHMIHFWFKRVFHLPIMQSVRYYLRFDTDSVIDNEPAVDVNLFKYMKENHLVYLGNDYNNDCGNVAAGLKALYTEYTNTVRGTWTNQAMWNKQQSNTDGCVFGFFNNFEIGSVEFFLREDVLNWTDYVDRSNGIYEHRWGDAILRYLTIGMFATEDQLGQRSSSEATKVDYTHGPATHAYVSQENYNQELKELLNSKC